MLCTWSRASRSGIGATQNAFRRHVTDDEGDPGSGRGPMRKIGPTSPVFCCWTRIGALQRKFFSHIANRRDRVYNFAAVALSQQRRYSAKPISFRQGARLRARRHSRDRSPVPQRRTTMGRTPKATRMTSAATLSRSGDTLRVTARQRSLPRRRWRTRSCVTWCSIITSRSIEST